MEGFQNESNQVFLCLPNSPTPLGNGSLVKLEGFTTCQVWVVEGYWKRGILKTLRTMTVILPNYSKELSLINAFRLDEHTEKELLKLGHISQPSSYTCAINVSFIDSNRERSSIVF